MPLGSTSTTLYNQLSTISSILSLKQIVSQPTHYFHTGSPSTIDLAYLPPNFSFKVSVQPPIGKSDHNSVQVDIYQKSSLRCICQSSTKKVWSYRNADFTAINNSLQAVDWSTILSQDDVNDACTTFYRIFLDTVWSFTPLKTVSNSPLPSWLPRSILSKIKLCRLTYHRTVSSNTPRFWSEYRRLCNDITTEIRRSKSQYFNTLSKNSCQLWTYVRSLQCSHGSLPPPPLKQSNSTHSATSDQDKANILNEAFLNFFISDPLSSHSHQPLSVPMTDRSPMYPRIHLIFPFLWTFPNHLEDHFYHTYSKNFSTIFISIWIPSNLSPLPFL